MQKLDTELLHGKERDDFEKSSKYDEILVKLHRVKEQIAEEGGYDVAQIIAQVQRQSKTIREQFYQNQQ